MKPIVFLVVFLLAVAGGLWWNLPTNEDKLEAAIQQREFEMQVEREAIERFRHRNSPNCPITFTLEDLK